MKIQRCVELNLAQFCPGFIGNIITSKCGLQYSVNSLLKQVNVMDNIFTWGTCVWTKGRPGASSGTEKYEQNICYFNGIFPNTTCSLAPLRSHGMSVTMNQFNASLWLVTNLRPAIGCLIIRSYCFRDLAVMLRTTLLLLLLPTALQATYS